MTTVSFLAIATLSGCATFDNVAALKHVVKRAASDTRTWAPALGAAVFGAADWDRKVSDWAVEQQPLFGSREAALNAGDDLRDLAAAGAVVTALVIPDPVPRLAVQTGAHFAAAGTTWTLKHSVNRRRPDGSDEQSFPSGHATSAFAAATLAQRNLDSLELSPFARSGLGAGVDALAIGTAWARLESGSHYPSDVLAGAAIGHFMAAVVNDAFLTDARLGFLPSRHGSRLEFSLAF